MKRDSEIQQAVIRELRWDTRVDDGAARFTRGVRDVVDHLQIVPER